MIRLTLIVLLLTLIACSTASASVPPPPKFPCRRSPAPLLCRIHANLDRVDVLRRRMGQRFIVYRWVAERHPNPARRLRILMYWIRVRVETTARWHAYERTPWLSGAFYRDAMCIHRYESTNWHEPGSPGGGLQFLQGTWDAWGGARYAPTPGSAAPTDQLRVAYRVVRHDGGWREWSTHSLCGL